MSRGTSRIGRPPGQDIDTRVQSRLNNLESQPESWRSIESSDSGSLRIVRGLISDTGGVVNGAGFSVTKHGTGDMSATFTTAFPSNPCVTATIYYNAFGMRDEVYIYAITASAVRFNCTFTGDGTYRDRFVSFIAIGPTS